MPCRPWLRRYRASWRVRGYRPPACSSARSWDCPESGVSYGGRAHAHRRHIHHRRCSRCKDRSFCPCRSPRDFARDRARSDRARGSRRRAPIAEHACHPPSPAATDHASPRSRPIFEVRKPLGHTLHAHFALKDTSKLLTLAGSWIASPLHIRRNFNSTTRRDFASRLVSEPDRAGATLGRTASASTFLSTNPAFAIESAKARAG